MLGVIRQWVQRLLVPRRLEAIDEAMGPADRLTENLPLLTGNRSESVERRVVLGEREGRQERRLGHACDAKEVTSRGGTRHAQLGGYDLHAKVRWTRTTGRVGAGCRYILRPSFAQERLRSDGRVTLEVRRAWYDGTGEPVFEPGELL